MGLSDDQRALLRLLAQREEGYGDIAALMGLSVDEVRRRVRGALEGLDEEGSAAGPVAAGDPPPLPVAEASSGAVPPTAPPAEEAPAPPPVSPASRPARPKPQRQLPLPQGRRRLWELVGGALVILLLILFATGAIDIGGDDSGSDGGDTVAATLPAGAEGNLTQAVLEPVDGGDASGRALFGKVGKEEVVLQVVAEGLDPSDAGETYTVWLYRSPKLSLRVGAVKVGEEGQLAARFPVPAELLAFVANGAFKEIYVSRTSDAEYKAEVAAAKRQRRLPRYTGETVLRGEIAGPITELGTKGG